MNVADLRRALDDFGDLLEVTIEVGAKEYEEIEVDSADGPDGPCVVLIGRNLDE